MPAVRAVPEALCSGITVNTRLSIEKSVSKNAQALGANDVFGEPPTYFPLAKSEGEKSLDNKPHVHETNLLLDTTNTDASATTGSAVCDASSEKPILIAQVPGAYLPSLYGDVSYGPVPFGAEPPAAPQSTSFSNRILHLENDIEHYRRPYISNISTYMNQPLSPINGRLDSYAQGVEAGFSPRRNVAVSVDILPSVFGLGKPTLGGIEYIGNVSSQVTDRLYSRTSLGLFQVFGGPTKPGVGVIGSQFFSYAVNDRFHINAGYLRDVVGNSRLSATGLNLPGTNNLVGRVKRNDFGIGFSYRPYRKTQINFIYEGGFYDGHGERTNPFQEFNTQVAHNWITREPGTHVQFLQTSYQLLAAGFKYDLSGVGNLALTPQGNFAYANNPAVLFASSQGMTTTPGITSGNPGVGGYFSPQIFILQQIRADMKGRIAGPVYYRIGGGLGPQNFKSTGQSLGNTTLVGTANASVIWNVNKHVTMDTGWYFIQAGTQYQRNVIYNQTRYTF